MDLAYSLVEKKNKKKDCQQKKLTLFQYLIIDLPWKSRLIGKSKTLTALLVGSLMVDLDTVCPVWFVIDI